MSQEIIYTSSPQGLRPGSFGFCTVATTPGMATPLAERLEALSGYRHAYPPGDPRAPLNPVVWSHLVLKVGGQRLHVLSRIADAGLDYSQRTNKLAHHVALGTNELSPAGPAWVLAQPGFAETKFQGAPRILPAGRKPPIGNLAPQVCRAWGETAGDAGWAGVLAQHALEGKRPAYLIFPEGTNILPLLVEAQSLLPPARRWEVSFSTYFTRLPAGVDCLWRCVLAGSPEATAALALRGEMVIDLTQKLDAAPDGPLVRAARTGKLAAGAATARGSEMLVVDESDEVADEQTRYRLVPDEEARLAPPPVKASRSQLGRSIQTNSSQHAGRWSHDLLVTSLATTVVVLLLLSGGLGGTLWYRSRQKQIANAGANEPRQNTMEQSDTTDSQSDAPEKPQLATTASATPVADSVSDPHNAYDSAVKNQPDDSSGPSSTQPSNTPPAAQPQPVPPKPVFDPNVIGPIDPIWPTDVGSPPAIDFARIGENLIPEDISLSLVGSQGKDSQLTVTPSKGESNARVWKVVSSQIAKSDLTSPVEVGVFTLTHADNDKLSFCWGRQAESISLSRNLLARSKMRIAYDDSQSHELFIGAPILCPAIQHANLKFDVAIPVGPLKGLKIEELSLDEVEVGFTPERPDMKWARDDSPSPKTKREYRCKTNSRLVLTVQMDATDLETPKLIGQFKYFGSDGATGTKGGKSRTLTQSELRNQKGLIENVSKLKEDYSAIDTRIRELTESPKKGKVENGSGKSNEQLLSELTPKRAAINQKLLELKGASIHFRDDDDYRNTAATFLEFLENHGQVSLSCKISRVINLGNSQSTSVPLVVFAESQP